MKITRDVIADLWPLYADGAVSPDTRALVEEFFRQDPEWLKVMHAAHNTALPPSDVKPDEEARLFNRIKRRQQWVLWMFLLAMVFSFQAFGRIISDTSWDVSPKMFIISAAVAGCFWIGFIVVAVRVRRLGP